MVDAATVVWQAALLAAIALTGFRFHLERHPENRDVFLMFAPLSGLLLADWADVLLGGASGRVVEYLALGLILVHPYAMLRVVDRLRPVRETSKRGALVGLGAALGILIAAPVPRPDVLTMALAAYFVVVEGYAAILLGAGSRSASGANRTRLRFASAGALLVGLAIFTAFNWTVLPGDAGLRIAGLQTLVVGGFVSLLAGFAPPRALTRAWDLRTVHKAKQANREAHTVEELVEGAIDRFVSVAEEVARPRGWVLFLERGQGEQIRSRPSDLNVPTQPLSSGGTLPRCLRSGEVQRHRDATNAPGWEGSVAHSLRTDSIVTIPIRTSLGTSDVRGAIVLFLHELPLFPGQREAFLAIHSEELAQALEMESLAEARERERLASLERETQALQEAEVMKAEFLATMSHEIRTPVNAILGSAELLRDVVEEEGRHHVGTIEQSGDHLLTVLGDIVNLSKIEADEVEIQRRPVHVREFIESCLGLVAESASSKGLELASTIAPDTPVAVRMDPARVRQVLVNLLTNAVKFTDAGQVAIHVEAEATGEEGTPACLAFTVEDTGPGIPFEEQDAVFEPFHQVEPSTTREHDGTGLGLAICQRLVELMDGSISVQSAPGQGSSFRVRIPAEPTEVIEDVVEPDTQFLEGATALVQVQDGHLEARVREHLEAWGMVVGAEDELDQQGDRPDVAILDAAAYERKRLSDRGRPAPVSIVLTAGDEPPVAGEPGVEAVGKPVRASQLHQALGRLLGSSTGTEPAEGEDGGRDLAETPLAILIVEDNEVNLRVVSAVLEKMGFDPSAAASGEKALRIMEAQPFDLVFLDIGMPGMDGFEVAKAIREGLPVADQPRIVALTAHVEDHYRDRAHLAGMDGFLTKPVERADLVAEIRHTIQERDATEPAEPAPGRSNASAQPPVLDEAYLATLEEQVGSEDLGGLFESFETEARRLLEELDQAAHEEEGEAIEARAHALGDIARNLGARRLAREAEAVERIPREPGDDDVDDRVDRLRVLLERTLEELPAPR